jgi:hydroxylamine dehydrogenase
MRKSNGLGFILWHHEGRRARHGASMMAPDYAHWHGMYEVAERFYQQLIPQARELAHQAEVAGKSAEAAAVRQTIDDILARPEHQWYEGPPKSAATSAAESAPAKKD